MKFNYNDGGRSASGYKGHAGDCVCRAICIITGKPYKEVYEVLATGNATQRKGKRGSSKDGIKTAARGINTKRKWFADYMTSLGFVWTPTMLIGQGCKVHLCADELPKGKLIAKVSKHFTAIIDGVINDTHNPSKRGATIYPNNYPQNDLPKGAYKMENGNGFALLNQRCVYGYYTYNYAL